MRVSVLLFALAQLFLQVVFAQPPAEQQAPPAGKTYDDIMAEINVLRFIRKWRFTKAQVEQMYKLISQLLKAQEEYEKALNSAEVLKAFWRVRMALLHGEDANALLDKANELEGEVTGKLWEEYENLRERTLDELRKLLNDEQASKMAIEGTVWGRLIEVANEFVEMAKAEEDTWVEWRTSVANELRNTARELNPQAPKNVGDQITILLIKLRQLAVEQPQQARADLHKRLLEMLLPEEKRAGPTKEEAEERIRDSLYALLENLRATESVLKEMLTVK